VTGRARRGTVSRERATVCVDIPLAGHGDEGCWREIIEHVYQVDWRITNVTRIGIARTTLRIRYSGRVVPPPVLEAIAAVSTAISASHERIPVEVIFSHRDGEPGREPDALRQLVERGAVRLTRDGCIEASGLFLRVMGGLKQELRRYARGLGAEEYEFPSLLPIDVARRCGIFDNQPHHVHFVSTVKSTLGGVRGSLAAITKAGAPGESRNQLARPHMILSPAVCYHYWSGGRPGSGGSRAIELGTATGRCYRFEAPALVGLDRLREFTMWEIFAAGEPDGTRALRLRCLDYIKDLMVRLDLAGRVATASDSFFADVHARKRMFQVNMQLKHELQLWLPHKGEAIAAASVNDHRDFFTRAFRTAPDGRATLHSFCMAVGLERLTLAVLSQHGLEPVRWPPALASLVGT
jgi:tRNA synthetase class II core domain (G, H, P, S and T)